MAGRSKNLLKNNSAQEGLDHWEVVANGGDGFTVEDPPAGCKSINECANVKGEKACWATSHDPCEKVQVVDLLGAGISENKLDYKKPPITIRDWYGCRFDCGCSYRLIARLLGADKEELDQWEFEDTKEEGSDWTKVRHVFKDYPDGVRYVEFRHGGQDNKNWAGHYGVKLSRSGVFVGQKKSKRTKRALKELKDKNLIKNPCAAEEFEGWEVLSSGGDGMIREEVPGGCKSLAECGADLEGDVGCWATSYGLGQKRQVVDLEAQGLDGDFMDGAKPEIKISEWHGARSDAGCEYMLTVRLLDAENEEIDKVDIRKTKDATGDWSQVTHTFRDYGDGVRFIEYTHGGNDTCNWAGHYGAKFTASTVVVCAPGSDKTSSSSSSDD